MELFRSARNLFVAVFGLWMLSSGPYSLPGLYPEGSWLILLVGLASSLGVVWLCHGLGIVDRENVPLHWTPRTSIYVVWLAKRVVLSSLDVVRRIWIGGALVDPDVLIINSSAVTNIGRATHANSITLTPGTVTIDTEGSKLTVHTIAKKAVTRKGPGDKPGHKRFKTDGWVRWVERGSEGKRAGGEAGGE